ncbi:MAG TPA: hypothetical protein VGW38_14130, partial [Chloroflexota bacterium]|nr:hypothetical protein [Chloroflexota bacterium]
PRGSRMVPIQLDAENHTPGRMSAPATRVFVRPVALLFAALGLQGGVRQVLERGQALYRLSHRLSEADRRTLAHDDAFLRLAAWLSIQADRGQGAPKLLVQLPPGWEGFAPWLEQLVEESLGKDGKGFLIFYGQSPDATYGEDCAVLRIAVEGLPEPPAGPSGLPVLTLHVPHSTSPLSPSGRGAGGEGSPEKRRIGGEGSPSLAHLGELAALFLCFKKTVAAYGYLQDIVFVGQPAVEAYKKYARDLREASGPVVLDQGAAGDTRGAGRATEDGLSLDYSSLLKRNLLTLNDLQARVERLGGVVDHLADVLAAVLTAAGDAGSLRYLDLTWNGELTAEVRRVLDHGQERLANQLLHIPAKVRTGPSDYHSTEQGETDGPPELVSVRLVAEQHEPVAAGEYDDKFLLAQARGTWQAMEDAGRWIVFGTLPDISMRSLQALERVFEQAASRIAGT